jgi:ABC-type sugar transport system ATPase subunit
MTATMTTGITSRDLTKRFDGVTVLESAEFDCAAGTLTVVTGRRGSGRSTLLRCLTGVYRPDAGEVTYRLAGDAVDLSTADPRTAAWVRMRHIATFDGVLAAPPQLPAAVAVARVARCTRAAAAAALARLDAGAVAAVAVGRLRSRDRHIVALAAALLAERQFVVLDEPENHVAPVVLATWLQRLRDAGATVVVTAAPGSALTSIATTVGELREGRMT